MDILFLCVKVFQGESWELECMGQRTSDPLSQGSHSQMYICVWF